MAFVDEVAAMFAALLIVRTEPVAGVIVTFDAATCVYPVKSSTGAGAVAAGANLFSIRCEVTDEAPLVAGAWPVPPGEPMERLLKNAVALHLAQIRALTPGAYR
jgi:hypothetical protein